MLHAGPRLQYLHTQYAYFTYKLANCILWSKQRLGPAWQHAQAAHDKISQHLTGPLQTLIRSSRADAELVAALWPVAVIAAVLAALALRAATRKAQVRRSAHKAAARRR